MRRETAAVAMSGGIDSSLAAALLVEEGYEVVGVTLELRCVGSGPGKEWARSCLAASSIAAAERVAHALGIPHRVVDASARFESDVVGPFRETYLRGETPNPCVECNARVKFGFLLETVRSWGLDLLATGHYARTVWDPDEERTALLAGVDAAKDQSYFLWRLSQDPLGSAIFPVGALTKKQVLEEARSRNLSFRRPAESQDVCFIPRGDCAGWLESQVPEGTGKGWFRDPSGRVLGPHRGIYRYTVGQRRGLGVAAGERRYVVGIEVDDRTVVLGGEEDLYCDGLVAGDVNYLCARESLLGCRVEARIRHRHPSQPARVQPHPEGVRVEFETPQRAVTPGQSVVFYRGDRVLGGGVIRRADGRRRDPRGAQGRGS